MEIGKLFTSETFSRYYTKEVLLFLEPTDFWNVISLNKFCASFAKDEDFIPVMARKNLRNGSANFVKVLESEYLARSIQASEQVICFLAVNGFAIYNKESKKVNLVSAHDIAGRIGGHDSYESSSEWISSDVLLIGFHVKRVEKRDTYYVSPTTFIFYNVKNGEIERTCKLKLPLHSFATIGMNYNSATDTLTLVQNTLSKVRTIVWDMAQNTHKIASFSGGTNGKFRAVHGDYMVSANLKGIHYYKISQDMLIAYIDFPAIKRLSQITLHDNLIIAHEELPNLNVLWHIWEVKGESIVPISTVKVPYQDNLRILIGAPLVPTVSQPFPLFMYYTTKQKMVVKLADFTLKDTNREILQINTNV